MTHPSGRILQCKVSQTGKKYNMVLKQLLVCHWSFEKLEFLQQNQENLVLAEFQLMFNQYDCKVTCFMLRLEKWCNRYRNGSIKFSPVVGLWIHQMQLYCWILHYHEGRVVHAGDLFWACQCLNVPDPNTLTPEEVTIKEEECVRWLSLLKEVAPKLHNEHLRMCLNKVQSQGDTEAVQSIVIFYALSQHRNAGNLYNKQSTWIVEGLSLA